MATLRILLIVVFLIAALAVTIVVLLQEGKPAGLGSMSGSGTNGDSYWDKNKKYSLEGKFERWTKTAAIVFVLSAFVLMFIPAPTTSTTEDNTTQTETTQPAETPADGTTEQPVESPTDEAADQPVEPSTDETTDQSEGGTKNSIDAKGETNGAAGTEETPAQ